ncbi:MAG: AIR carboxylase family protein [Methanosarcinales archaeon]|nr:AIR carboxylase family protein [Methanosarcinales archaeon]MCD4808846.1 AIR carboxylase family protein [Methanosarcinales archaeon]
MTTDVAVLLGSKSDRDISEKTIEIFDRSGIEYTIAVASAHKTLGKVIKMINKAHESGVKVLIAIAGMAARIIATGDKEPEDKLAAHRMELAEQSLQDSQTLFYKAGIN